MEERRGEDDDNRNLRSNNNPLLKEAIEYTGRILAEEVSEKPNSFYIQFKSPTNPDFSVLFPSQFLKIFGSHFEGIASIMLKLCNGGLITVDVPVTKTLGRDGIVEIILDRFGLIVAEYMTIKEDDIMLFNYQGSTTFKVYLYDWEILSGAETLRNAIDIGRQDKANCFVDSTSIHGKAKTNSEMPTVTATQQLQVYGSERPIAEEGLSDIDQQGACDTAADVNFDLVEEVNWDDFDFNTDHLSDFGLLGEENFDPAGSFLTSPTSPLVTLDRTLPPISNEPHPPYHLLNSDPYPTFTVPEHSAQAAALPTPLQPRADARDRELEESLSEQQPRAGGRDRVEEIPEQQLHPAEASHSRPLILTQSRELDQFNVLNEATSYEQMLHQPACTIVLKKTFLLNLRLPAKFIAVVKEAKTAHLIVENGKNGLASLSIKRYNSNGLYLGKGWNSFATANLLKQGDACVFEFVGEDIDKRLVQFRVSFFRGR